MARRGHALIRSRATAQVSNQDGVAELLGLLPMGRQFL
jgi:hypothetical protein